MVVLTLSIKKKIFSFDYGKIPKDTVVELEFYRKMSFFFIVMLVTTYILGIIYDRLLYALMFSLMFFVIETYYLKKWQKEYKILDEEYNTLSGEERIEMEIWNICNNLPNTIFHALLKIFKIY